jgi:hypothetical protein
MFVKKYPQFFDEFRKKVFFSVHRNFVEIAGSFISESDLGSMSQNFFISSPMLGQNKLDSLSKASILGASQNTYELGQGILKGEVSLHS